MFRKLGPFVLAALLLIGLGAGGTLLVQALTADKPHTAAPIVAAPATSGVTVDHAIPASDLGWTKAADATVQSLRWGTDEIGYDLRESGFRVVSQHVDDPNRPTMLVETWADQHGHAVETFNGETSGYAAFTFLVDGETYRCPAPMGAYQRSVKDTIAALAPTAKSCYDVAKGY